jgi:membrane-associated phospholipid phosphatase
VPKRLRTVLAVFAALVFASMWVGWEMGWNWLAVADTSTLEAAHRTSVEHHGWVTFWNVWCTVFSPLVFRVLVLGLIVAALVRGRGRTALFLILSVELSGVLTELVKWIADRPRPATAMVHAPSTSFPSGHALGTIVAVLALAVVLQPYVRRSLWPWLIALGVIIVVSVGVGRVALNVHHLSDVVAGWALGYLYFALCLLVLRRPVTAADEIPAVPGIAR